MENRSIKSSFWKDTKVFSLKNKSAILFYLGLKNYADENGFFFWDLNRIHLALPFFRKKEISVYLDCLIKAGLIERDHENGFISNWDQKKVGRKKGFILKKSRKEKKTVEVNCSLIDPLKMFDTNQLLEATFLSRRVSEEKQTSFLEAFPDPRWIVQESIKAISWEKVNSKKKDFSRFLFNWFSRGWDRRNLKYNRGLERENLKIDQEIQEMISDVSRKA